MANLKKWLSYVGIYLAGVLTALIIFKATAFIEQLKGPKPINLHQNSMGLIHLPNHVPLPQGTPPVPPDLSKLIAGMQRNFQDDDLMGQFIEMRKKMLQLLEEEGGTPNLAFDQTNDMADSKIGSREDDKNYYYDVDLGEIDQNSLKMDIKDGYIYINGEMKKEEKEESKLGVSSRTMVSSFSKTVPIPSDAEAKKAKIEQKNSILTITIPKKS